MATKAIPVALRERIVQLYDQEGRGTAEIAASFGYCVAAVRRSASTSKSAATQHSANACAG